MFWSSKRDRRACAEKREKPGFFRYRRGKFNSFLKTLHQKPGFFVKITPS